MTQKILKNIERLSLHDSHIEKIVRADNKMILTLDWAKLTNYSESNIDEGIILGKCELIFENLNNEKLSLDFSGIPGKVKLNKEEIKFDRQLFNDWLILENKPLVQNKYRLCGLIDYKESSAWLEWEFSFSNFELNWSNSVTWVEWQNGKLVRE